jgi:hypothetical protein
MQAALMRSVMCCVMSWFINFPLKTTGTTTLRDRVGNRNSLKPFANSTTALRIQLWPKCRSILLVYSVLARSPRNNSRCRAHGQYSCGLRDVPNSQFNRVTIITRTLFTQISQFYDILTLFISFAFWFHSPVVLRQATNTYEDSTTLIGINDLIIIALQSYSPITRRHRRSVPRIINGSPKCGAQYGWS